MHQMELPGWAARRTRQATSILYLQYGRVKILYMSVRGKLEHGMSQTDRFYVYQYIRYCFIPND